MIRQSAHWRTAVNRNQNLLGKTMIVLRRHEEALTALSADEWSDLRTEVAWVTGRLTDLFCPVHFNYAFLQNVDRHVHMHVVPRYERPRRFSGMQFTDPDYPGHYEPGVEKRVPPDVIAALGAALAGEDADNSNDSCSRVNTADSPLLVLVTGPPGVGKTTLARPLAEALGLPLIARDDLKEVLYDQLGTGDRDWSRELGLASFELLHAMAARLLETGIGAVLEANFFRGVSEKALQQLPRHRLVQIHCSAPDEVVLERYTTRVGRHPGHVDAERREELEARLANRGHDPLDLPGFVISVDATSPPDIAAVAMQVLRSY